MKLTLNITSILVIVFSFILVLPISSGANSAPNLGGTTQTKSEKWQTEADFFAPSCPYCATMQTPGKCNLGSGGCNVFRPDTQGSSNKNNNGQNKRARK